MALATAVMLAVDDGKLELDAPVQRYVPAFQGKGKEQVTVRLLLAHASGLPAWRPLFRETKTREEAFALADSTPLSSPPGTADVYSDLGMIVLTQAVEAAYHERIDSLLARRIFQPLGMTSVRFLPEGAMPESRPPSRSLAGTGLRGRSARRERRPTGRCVGPRGSLRGGAGPADVCGVATRGDKQTSGRLRWSPFSVRPSARPPVHHS